MSNGAAGLGLCAIGVLLFTLATASDCVATSSFPTVSGEGIDFDARTYRGEAHIAAEKMGLTDFIRAQTIGEEGCLLTLETDWDVESMFPSFGTQPLLGGPYGVSAKDSGGYADPGLNPFHACNTYQFLAWTFRWGWDVGDNVGSGAGGLCYNIRGAERVC